MATNIEVMQFLRPNGGWVQTGGTYEGIEFIECEPFTKEEYEAAFEKVELAKAQAAAEAAAAKAALLAKLGITEEEVRLLLGGM